MATSRTAATRHPRATHYENRSRKCAFDALADYRLRLPRNPLVHELVRGVEVIGAAAWRKASSKAWPRKRKLSSKGSCQNSLSETALFFVIISSLAFVGCTSWVLHYRICLGGSGSRRRGPNRVGTLLGRDS